MPAIRFTGDQVRQQLTAWDQSADIVTLLLPPGLPWPSIEATLLAAAPDRGGSRDRVQDGAVKR